MRLAFVVQARQALHQPIAVIDFQLFGIQSDRDPLADEPRWQRVSPPQHRNRAGSGHLSSLGNPNGAMVGLILRLSIAGEFFTRYVQLSEEATEGLTGNASPTTTAHLPDRRAAIIHY
jgi:hypothetical protein